MALSPNYGWAEPDNSSLVKNGAQDIRALGDAIDTSVWNVGYGQGGKNKIINGDLSVNQRSFTTGTGTANFSFDRWFTSYAGGTTTTTSENFTAGAAPVVGYESKNFVQLASTGQTSASHYVYILQKVEDVRTFANQTVTVSVYAKATSGTPNIGVSIAQNFGSGGSSQVITSPAIKAITSSWARYSFTVNVPSISGKTIGTSSFLEVGFFTSCGTSVSASGYPAVGLQNATIGFWGMQVEYGSKATPFQTASGGSIQGELAMCQRYYVRYGTTSTGKKYGTGAFVSSTLGYAIVIFPTEMRVAPTSFDFAGTNGIYDFGADRVATALSVDSGSNNPKNTIVAITVASGGVQYRPFFFNATGDSSAYIAFSAEL
jgi:hypothetical protein